MLRANTPLASLCALVLGVACTPGREEPARAERKVTARRALGEGPASLLADLDLKDEGALVRYPSNLVAAGTTLLYAATEDSTGTELWRFDASGPSLVADINPGTPGSSPSNFFHMRGLTYFTAQDSQHGVELWRTDGTLGGTFLLKDIQPGTPSSYASGFTEYNGWVFFCAYDEVHGNELWRTDGTPEGTVLVRDILLGTGNSSPSSFTVLGGALYFVATGPGGTLQLWRTDGTQAGTVAVSSKVTVSGSANTGGLVRVGNTLFFAGSDGTTGNELWKTDGTEAGTVRVKDILPGSTGSDPQRLTAFQGALYFAASDGVKGRELWTSDGTGAGTKLVVDLTSGNTTTQTPDLLTATATRLFFTVNDGSGASPLYATDGTAAGTVKVVDFKALGGGRGPASLTANGGTLYFTGYESSVGAELWTSDGTAAGTHRIGNDLFPGNRTTDPSPNQLTVLGDTVYFVATAPGTGLTTEYPAIPTLWKTKGDVATTVPAGAEPKPTRGSHPAPFATMNGALYFTTFTDFDEDDTPKLWRSDGTAAGTTKLADIGPSGFGLVSEAGLSALAPMNGRLYFASYQATPTPGYQLWSTDGTPTGTTPVSTAVQLSAEASFPIELVPYGGSLFFAGQDSRGIELWKTDGTAAGTVLVKDIRPSSGLSSRPHQFTAMGGFLYFLVRDGFTGTELWRTDGTAAGTSLVKDIRNGAGMASVVNIAAAMDGFLYFVAEDASTGTELWRTDGTEAGTVLVKDIAPGSASSTPVNFQVVGRTLFFAANTSETGYELWKTDGTDAGTVLVKDIAPGSAHSLPSIPTVLDGTLYFIAMDPTSGAELWRSDGTEAGTTRVADIGPGRADGILTGSLFALPTEKLLLFAANDGVNGIELWRSDGTAAGTFLLHDIAPGQLGSEPDSFALFGESIVFGADDRRNGREPWLMARSLLTNTTPPTITCPANQTVEAQQALGALVHFPDATTSDDTALPPAVVYSQGPEAFFPFGTTKVTATARDSAGLTASCSFTVTVRDTTPPTPVCPSDASIEATSESGAVVTFPAPVATDAVTRVPTLTVSRASGSTFPQGATQVTVTASDAAGNSNQCTFTVLVRDTTAAVLTCPADTYVEATDLGGAIATWTPATATDAASKPTVTSDHTSGTRFPFGDTPVTATATDAAGNVSTCTFQVIVRDTQAPTVHCPAPIEVEALGPSGAPAEFVITDAADTVSDVTVTTSHASGTTFPVGETAVRVRATDAAGNMAECVLPIRVLDTLPPLLTCPSDMNAGKGPVAVELPKPSATDRVTTSPEVILSPASGSVFQPGDTPVEVTARDASGNTATCTFTVHVEPGGCGGCSSQASGAAGWLGLLSLLMLATRGRSRTRSGL